MEVLLGTPPPPPPPERPDARGDRPSAKDGKLLTTRERMEMHRANPTCNSCHRFMDPIGLALDNFDVTGKWRERENGMPLDTRGDFYDGTPVTTPAELTAALLKRPMPLVRTFTENLMAYALGRRVEYFDQPTDSRDRQGGRSERLQDVVVHPGRRQERRVPDEAGRARRRPTTTESRSAATNPNSRRPTMQFLTGKQHAPPHVPPRRWAPRWRCRSSTRWCRPGGIGAQARGRRPHAADLHRGGARPGRLQQLGRHASTCSRRRRPAATSRSCRTARSASLEPYRDYLTIVSNTDVRMAEAFARRKSAATTSARARCSSRSRIRSRRRAPTSGPAPRSISSYAQHFGQATPMPSMQFCIENLDQAGGCTYNYSCAYTDSISWASPNEPLPMIRDPRVAFDMLFGAGGIAAGSRRAPRDAPQHPRLDRRRSGRRAQASSAPATGTRLDQLPRQRARDRAPHPGGRGAQHAAAKRASCPTRRPACPTRSPST